MQKTLKRKVVLSAPTLWSGGSSRVTLLPAEPDTGISIVRVDKTPPIRFKLSMSNAEIESSRVVLKHGKEKLAFVEHLLAALYGLGIDNVIVEVKGEELPFFDGSSHEYVRAICKAGLIEQKPAQKKLALKKAFLLLLHGRVLYLRPSPRLGISYVFFHKGLRLKRFLDVQAVFAKEIAPARTFAAGPFPRFSYPFEVHKSKRLSFPYPARFDDEMLRHKVLDMVGDLAFLGKRLAAHIWAFGTGHRHTHEAVSLLLKEI